MQWMLGICAYFETGVNFCAMAGRGIGRGRSRGILESVLTTPGGLAARREENGKQETDTKSPQVDQSSKSPVSDHSNLSLSGNASSGDTNGQPTLSLNDMKSILEDTRTYSEQSDVRRVFVCAKNFVRTEADVKALAAVIYNKCLEDTSLAKRGAEICDSLTSIEVANTKFRSCLLSLVQTDYKDRNELVVQNPQRFSGFLAFLCEIFAIMRTATHEVFKPLINPIFDCLNLVLGPQTKEKNEEGDDDDDDGDEETFKGASDFIVNEDLCETFSVQLQNVGRLLEEHGEDQMKKLLNRVRMCVIMSKSSPRVRCSLLEVIETYTRGWEVASNDMAKFYCDVAVGIISGLVL